MLRWYWQILIYLILALIIFFWTTIYQFLKYHLSWNFDREWLQFRLNDIWKKSGLIEIQGGAQTGKTLLIILLTAHLKGRKWVNLPNTVPGHQELDLSTLRQHRLGNYKGGIVGSNNVLLIDEPWNFFSKAELKKVNLEHDLSKILWFMSETSKHDWKIFYVQKLGARLPEAFNLLSANKTATIQTLGLENFCHYWGKKYYYLRYRIIPNGENIKSSKTSWWKKWFQSGGIKDRYIPVSEDDFNYHDKTWNLDPLYAKNRLTSISGGLKYDGLTEIIKAGVSRRQTLRKEQESLNFWKKHDPNRKKDMLFEGKRVAKEQGLWKPAEENIAEKEAKLQQQLENGEITLEECELEMENITNNRRKLAEKIAKNHPEPAGEPEMPNKKPPFKNRKGQKGWHREEEE